MDGKVMRRKVTKAFMRRKKGHAESWDSSFLDAHKAMRDLGRSEVPSNGGHEGRSKRDPDMGIKAAQGAGPSTKHAGSGCLWRVDDVGAKIKTGGAASGRSRRELECLCDDGMLRVTICRRTRSPCASGGEPSTRAKGLPLLLFYR